MALRLAVMLMSFSDGCVSMFATSCMVFAIGAVVLEVCVWPILFA